LEPRFAYNVYFYSLREQYVQYNKSSIGWLKLKTEWDYTRLASSYLLRPQYSTELVNAIFSISTSEPGGKSADIGAGVGHLTKHHLRAGLEVTAVEPNDEMRRLGIQETESKCIWLEGTGEETKIGSKSVQLVTFGSSFNVCNQALALHESHRILVEKGWFACLWNHRDLTDPIQASIESIIQTHIPEYEYGSRREDQSKIIIESGLFNNPVFLQSSVVHEQSLKDCVIAWRSHATLQRQAGGKFEEIINDIETYLHGDTCPTDNHNMIKVPYQTVCWVAQAI
jgi:ubiquinone/menaquinone biosynthesis C-methylase UbiE